METKFEIKKNDLHRKSYIKSMELENDHYHVHIFYEGDYDSDKASGHIDESLVSLSAKPKNTDFQINYLDKSMTIETETAMSVDLKDMDKFKAELDMAISSAESLSAIIKEYFSNQQ